jgi:O-antigen/teichoic acid export membrane protein
VLIEQIAKPALRVVLVATAIAFGLGVTGVALAWTIPVALGLVVTAAIVLRLLRREEENASNPAARPLSEVAGEFWRFAAPRGGASLFAINALWLDILLVGALASEREAGIYAGATRYVTIGVLVIQMIFVVVAPQVSALLATGEVKRVEDVFRTATTWLTALSWPVYLTIAVFAPLCLSVFGTEFSEGSSALTLLALATLVNMATGPVAVVLLMAGKSLWQLGSTMAAFTVNVTLSVLLIPRLGVTGAAIALSVSVIMSNVVLTALVWFALRIHPFARGLGIVCAGCLALYGLLPLALRLAFGGSAPTLVFSFGVATVIYIGLLWRFRDYLALAALRDGFRLRTGRAVGDLA